MVKIKEDKNTGGVFVEDTDKFMDNIEKKVYQEFLDKKIVILSQGNMSNTEFKLKFDSEYNKYKKELKKLLRSSYRNVFNPLKTLEGLEYIWYKYEFIGVLTDDYVDGQRDRMYNSMQFPDIDIKNKVMAIKNKISKKFKL